MSTPTTNVTDYPELFDKVEQRIFRACQPGFPLKAATCKVADEIRAETTALDWEPHLVEAMTYFAIKTGAAIAGYAIEKGIVTREQILAD